MAGLLLLVQGHVVAGVLVIAAGVLLKVFGQRLSDRLFRRHARCEDGACETTPAEEPSDAAKTTEAR